MSVAARRRGSLYFAVLATAMMVFVVGMGGLLAARVHARSAADASDVIAARFCASSAIELALLQLENDPYGYVAPGGAGWQPTLALNRGACAWRLIDADDNTVATQVEGKLHLQGKGTARSAVRLLSVTLLARDRRIAENVITGGDMEGGVSWFTNGLCQYQYSPATPSSGAYCLAVNGRDDNGYGGPLQNVTAKLTNGQGWDMEVRMRTSSSPEQAVFVFYLTTSGSGPSQTTIMAPAQTAQVGAWTKVTATKTVSWSGTLQQAYFGVTTAGDQNYDIDDLLLVPSGTTGVDLHIQPGSWKQSVE
ncbi:MAG: carbohydrate binding domain-containing protein [Phycisphaerae bacterium]|nr:carbohydrate binding domain-containing protein [Phycisphaerae bacterium]MCZ2399851.1 carbohydrate binding domain-containing protein [Phycisphaerae bacterium]NUQ48484.1 carbohydrate binding domain-containing protein [Phycisphaerae bacterium]